MKELEIRGALYAIMSRNIGIDVSEDTGAGVYGIDDAVDAILATFKLTERSISPSSPP